MRTFTLAFITLLFSTTVLYAQPAKNNAAEKGANIEFVSEEFNFGSIYANSGHDGLAEFKFINTGNEPLILTNVKTSCGCTSPFWQKDPINPGDTGKIVLKYANLSQPHTISKSATVQSNALNKPTVVIRIAGTVVAKPEEVMPEKNIDKSASPFAQ
ncbi:MAG: hypothetical protein BWY70_00964 [Bacteroidetes bacterium ADurb.Bin408]|nr:MAG: hypothetical protein BWY70_00964 [Bacteroidetes bacterium ADurb.Bin408]